MPITKAPLKTPHLSLYLEDSEGIVLHKTNRSLYRLPTLSVAVLFAIDDGDSLKSIVSAMSNKYRLSKNQVEVIYHQIEKLFIDTSHQATYLDGRYPEFSASAKTVNLADEAQVATFKIADTAFSIDTTEQDLFDAIVALLSSCRISSSNPDFILSVVKTSSCYQIFCNGLLVETDLDFQHIMPLVIDRLQILSFQKSRYTFCFHGAALHMPQGTLLLPGKSGAGKSTLSAVLASMTNHLYSDEIIAFNKGFELCFLPLPIAIKSGSWDTLDRQYPNLNSMPTWERLDGRRLKYVWPNHSEPSHALENNAKDKVLLINPQFVHKKSDIAEGKKRAESKKLGVIETIALLTEGGYQLGFELDEARFDEFLTFISKAPRFKLLYIDSKQAIDKIDELWSLH